MKGVLAAGVSPGLHKRSAEGWGEPSRISAAHLPFQKGGWPHFFARVLLLLACIERAVWVRMTGVSGNGYFVFPVTLGAARKPLSI